MRRSIFAALVLLAASSCNKTPSPPAEKPAATPATGALAPILPAAVNVEGDGGGTGVVAPPLPPAERAAPEACRTACENVARLQKQAADELGKIKVHEFEEMMELSLKQIESDLVRIKQEMVSPPPPFDDSVLKNPKLTAQGRREIKATYEMQLKELRRQRVDALEKSTNAKAEFLQKFEFLKKKTLGDADKAGKDAGDACKADCDGGRKSIKEAQCLIDARLPVDLTVCRAP